MKDSNYLKKELYDLIKTDESIFDFIQESSLDGLWYWDLEHPEEEWMNPKFWSVLGYDHREMPHKASAWQKIIHPEDLKLATENLIRHCENPDYPYDQTVRYTHKNGSTVWIKCCGFAIRDEHGKPLRMLGTHQDITAFKNNELLLQKNADLLRNAQQVSKIGSWELDIKTNEVIWTEELYKMYGFDPTLPPPPYPEHMKLFTPESWEMLTSSLALAREQGIPYELELTTIRKDGSNGWMWVRGEAVFDENKHIVGLRGVAQDITEKKRKDAEITAISKEIKDITNAVNEVSALSITNAQGIFIKVNKQLCELSGYTEEELIGQNHNILNTDYHDAEFWRSQRETIMAGRTWKGEIKNRKKDGSEYWVNCVIQPTLDQAGELIQYISIRQDITDRKKAELILQESEKKFRELFENLIDEVHLWKVIRDKTGKIMGWQLVDANPAALKSWGKSIHEVTGKTANEIFEADAHAQFMPIVEKIFTTGEPYYWEEYFSATDQHLYMESIPFGDYFISTGKDITEQKKVQQALQESELRFSIAIEGTEAGIWDWDMINNKVVFSRQWKAMLGYEEAEVENSFEGWQNLWHPNDAASIEKAVTDHLNGITQKYEVIHRCRHKNGGWRWIMTRGKILRDIAGKPYRWIGTNVDITPQKQAEEDQKIAKEQAEAASKAKSEFLANMSHEIRTPLNGVIGFTELLTKTPLNPVQQQYAHSANVSGHTLLGIINDILDFSKIEAGMLELEVIKTDMAELLENSIDIVKFSAAGKELELLLDIDPAMPRFAYIDPIRTKQILANLLGNAVKFTKKGEVVLKAVYQALDDAQGKLSISVRDTGIGITEEQKTKLFKSFSQADSSTTRKFGGTGLGLVISQMIAEKMGSKINIDSVPDVGSTFFFDIITHFEGVERPDTTQITGIKHCLIIDDNYNSQVILAQMLKHWQIASDFCNNGFEALQKLESSQLYDVIICDYDMPYLNGIDTIRIIKEKLKLNIENPPFVLLHSSLDNTEMSQKCKESGVGFFLNKPVKSFDLFNILSQISQKTETISRYYEAEQSVDISSASKKIKILIAEDNPLNMLLSKIILLQMMPNSKVYEARTGLEAVEQYNNVAPNLIFMDVHMPELDGIEATKRIRALEAGKGNRLPIIALTAGVLREEKEKCIAAGMDDFLTKPLESRKIQTVLNKLFQQGEKITSDLQEKSATEETHFRFSELLNNLGGDIKVMQQLISSSLNEIQTRINMLEEAYKKIDIQSIKLITHSVKGISLSMCFYVLADIAGKIDNDSEKSFQKMEVLLVELKNEWIVVKQILRQKMDS